MLLRYPLKEIKNLKVGDYFVVNGIKVYLEDDDPNYEYPYNLLLTVEDSVADKIIDYAEVEYSNDFVEIYIEFATMNITKEYEIDGKKFITEIVDLRNIYTTPSGTIVELGLEGKHEGEEEYKYYRLETEPVQYTIEEVLKMPMEDILNLPVHMIY